MSDVPAISIHRPAARRSRDTSIVGDYTTNLGAAMLRRKTMLALKAARAEAEMASRAKSEFIANMSHELRTPLNSIIGFSELLRTMDNMDHQRMVEYAGYIHKAAQHLTSLINGILDFSKAQVGRLEIAPQSVDPDEIITNCLTLMHQRAEAAGLRLSYEKDDAMPAHIIADPLRLKQVLLNLLSNAIKFTPSGGEVSLYAEMAVGERLYKLTVSDTGIGMTPEEMDVAMRPFGQVRSGLERGVEGTGLGLTISKALVELHGGRMTMRSAKGKGTSISVELPVAGPANMRD